jgi:hypothetical protein
MTEKIDQDSSPGIKLLRFFNKLMFENKKHFQTDLAEWLSCSPQTVIRLAREIETVAGLNFEMGLEGRKRWYRMKSSAAGRLGMNHEEVRYLGLCRDLAVNILPSDVIERIDRNLFALSLNITEEKSLAEGMKSKQLLFFSKGRIDYTPHRDTLEKLLLATEKKLVCLVNYRASGRYNEEAREHSFAPGRLISLNNALYVLGASLNNDNSLKFFTNLAIHRIRLIEVTNTKFDIVIPEPDPQTFGFPFHPPKTFNIRFHKGKPADYVRERVWADDQKITEEAEGGLVLTITTRSEMELMAWVRSFGENCELIGTSSAEKF